MASRNNADRQTVNEANAAVGARGDATALAPTARLALCQLARVLARQAARDQYACTHSNHLETNDEAQR